MKKVFKSIRTWWASTYVLRKEIAYVIYKAKGL